MLEDGDGVADLLDFVEQVAAEDDGTAFRGEFGDEGADFAGALRVEAVGRLIEDDEFGVVEDSGGDAEPLLHAERVVLEAAVGGFDEVDAFQRRSR